MKPCYVDITNLTDNELIELHDRFVENDASSCDVPCKGQGHPGEYFGVDYYNDIVFYINSNSFSSAGNIARELTLEQVREQFPLPTDKATKVSPRDLACFDQVAAVIGEESAEIELGKVLSCDHDRIALEKGDDLIGAFIWWATPQVDGFWNSIDDGKMPVWFSKANSSESDSKVSDVVENVPKKKLLILGMGRHGKDSMAEHLLNEYGYTFSSSSEFAAKTFIFDALKGVLGYKDWQECFDDRHNYRTLWHELIRAYTKENPSRLAEEVLAAGNDIYVGMRSDIEVNCCIEKNLFDLIVWVDAEDRLGITEGDGSMTVPKEMAHIVLTNNTTLSTFKGKIDKLMGAFK